MNTYEQTTLHLESLEQRTLLSAYWEGLDIDGDLVKVKLRGPGELEVQTSDYDLGEQIEMISVFNTTPNSRLIVKAVPRGGDGVVDVLQFDGEGENLSKIDIDGYLGDLTVGFVKNIQVEGNIIFDDPQTGWTIDGDVKNIKFKTSMEDMALTVTGSANKVLVKGDMIAATMMIDGELRKLDVRGSIMENSFVSVLDRIQTLKVRGSIDQSDVESLQEIWTVKVGNDIFESTIYADWFLDYVIVDGGIIGSVLETPGDIGLIDVWLDIEESEIIAGPDGIGAIIAWNISDTNIETDGDVGAIYLDAYTSREVWDELVIVEENIYYWPVYDAAYIDVVYVDGYDSYVYVDGYWDVYYDAYYYDGFFHFDEFYIDVYL